LPPYEGAIDWEAAVKTLKSASDQDLALTLELKERSGPEALPLLDQLKNGAASLDRFEREWNES